MISHVVDFLKLRHQLSTKLLFKNKYNTLSPRKNETCFDVGALKIADISKQDIKIFEKSFDKLTNQPELLFFFQKSKLHQFKLRLYNIHDLKLNWSRHSHTPVRSGVVISSDLGDSKKSFPFVY